MDSEPVLIKETFDVAAVMQKEIMLEMILKLYERISF